ncbi:threonine/serine ThrE exporter family protein [Citricoccus sp. CH26A]|uniref:threonine/serine ThrE exporter family protein n=1 Tax=Citricoccus TaxID=169133 RepID=UPI000317B028|nr:threonine/serine exporter family protein [Citricoccus sp. CH26A]
MDDQARTRSGRRNIQEPPVELSQIPIIRPAAQTPAGAPSGEHPASGRPAVEESAPATSSITDFPLGPAAEAAGHVPTGQTPTAAPATGPQPTVTAPVAADGAGVGPVTDTPITEPPSSVPVPQSVLAPSEPITGEPPAAPVALRGPKKPRLRFSGSSAIRRIMYSEPLPTQALSMVDRIAGSPYANPYLRTTRLADADERTTLDFALKLAETLFRFGAGALEVETSIIVVTQAFGVHETEVDITNQSISLNYAPAGKTPYTLQRVVRSWSQNYAGLALMHRLVSAIAAGEVDRDEAQQRLADIRHKPKPFPKWLNTLSAGLFAATFVLFIGGGLVGAGVALLSTSLLITVMDVMGRARIPEFFATMAGGFIATVIALVLFELDVPLGPSLVVAGGIMLLLPSGRFVSAVQDAINGFPVTAAGRFVSAALIFAALIAGIMSAVVFASLMGFAELDVDNASSSTYPVWFMGLLVFLAAVWDSIFEQSEWKLLLPTALVSLTGFAAYAGAEALGVGPRLTPAIAAVVIGAVGRYVALRMGAPQLVVAVPAILFLLPGLTIFRSMYGIAMDSGALVDGLVGLFNASATIMAIAAGVVLGDTLARPFTTALQANERRRIGRR